MHLSIDGLGTFRIGKELLHLALVTILWPLWRERNTRTFDKKASLEEELWDPICSFLFFFRGAP